MENNSKDFWTGPNVKDYPNILRIGGKEYWEPGEYQRQLIGEQLLTMGWIGDGEKLDLGAGPSSKWIFGPEDTVTHVWAVDFAPELLSRSGVPEERRVIDDLRTMNFPEEWRGKFVLATAILLFRYLNEEDRKHLLTEVKTTLSHEGRLVIVDFESMRPENLSKEIGETARFDSNETEMVLQKLGYVRVEKGKWDFQLVYKGDPSPFSVNWITAVNP